MSETAASQSSVKAPRFHLSRRTRESLTGYLFVSPWIYLAAGLYGLSHHRFLFLFHDRLQYPQAASSSSA